MKNQTMLIACGVALLSACGPQGNLVEYEGQLVSQEQELLETSPPATSLHFNLGQDVQLGDFVVKVNKVTEHKAKNEYLQPDEGNRFVAVEVEYYNPTPDKQFDASPMDWILFDAEDYAYESALMVEHKTPDLNTTTVNPNGKIKGWVTFEVPQGATPKKVQFQPMFGDYANVEIALESN